MLILNGHQIDTLLFPNHESKVSKFLSYTIADSRNTLEFKYEGDHSLIQLWFVGYGLRQSGIDCRLIVDYMPYSRMDHEVPDDMETLPAACDLINQLGFSEVIVVEPHSSRTTDLLKNSRAFYPVPTWLPEIKKQIDFNEDRDHIVFPDKGAAARYETYGFKNVIVFDKLRDTTTEGKGKIIKFVIKEGKVNAGSKCIIIDDLSVFGGTFMACGTELKNMGAETVVLAVAHLEEAAYTTDRPTVLSDSSPIDKVFASTSIASTAHRKVQFMKVEVV